MEVNDVIGGKYEVMSIISEHDRSKVAICVNRYLKNKWIIKSINSLGINTPDEIEYMLKINSKKIPEVIDVIKTNGMHYYIMSYIKGHTVKEYTSTFKYSLKDIVFWMINVAEILMEIHCCNIIHGDIKCDNILIDDNKLVYIIDFGSSFVEIDNKSFTKRFVAPERLTDHYKIDDRSDIFSCGVVFRDILNEYKKNHPLKKYLDKKNIGKINRIINKCLQINPSNRYDSSKELYDKLKQVNYIT